MFRVNLLDRAVLVAYESVLIALAVLGSLAAFVGVFAHEGGQSLGFAVLSAALGYVAGWLAAGRGELRSSFETAMQWVVFGLVRLSLLGYVAIVWLALVL